MSENKQSFCANLSKDAKFEKGLRSCFEYRDLGVSNDTNGQFHAAVIRVTDDAKGDQDIRTTGMHRHECDFQMFYVLKGWVTMDYEGVGEITLHEGDCCLQPAGIAHNEIRCSEDNETLEIYSPAVHKTVALQEDIA